MKYILVVSVKVPRVLRCQRLGLGDKRNKRAKISHLKVGGTKSSAPKVRQNFKSNFKARKNLVMGKIRQKRKNRSSIPRAKLSNQRTRTGKKKINILGNDIIASKWCVISACIRVYCSDDH